jgi:hypothetical protein
MKRDVANVDNSQKCFCRMATDATATTANKYFVHILWRDEAPDVTEQESPEMDLVYFSYPAASVAVVAHIWPLALTV